MHTHCSLEQDARDTSVPSMPAPRHRRLLTPPPPLCDTARYCTPRRYLLAALQWGIMAPLNLVKVRRCHLTRALFIFNKKYNFPKSDPFRCGPVRVLDTVGTAGRGAVSLCSDVMLRLLQRLARR
jgi:hypothetical protein